MKELLMKKKFDFLASAELRLNSLKMYHPDSSEARRHQVIVDSMISDLNEEELIEYNKKKNFVETAAAKATRIKSELAAMSLNRDSQSI